MQIANDRHSHLLFEPNDTNYTIVDDVDTLVREITKERNAAGFFHESVVETSSPRRWIRARRKSANRGACEKAGNEEKRRNH